MSCKHKYEKDGIYREFETEEEIIDFLREYEINGILPEEINTNPEESEFGFKTLRGLITTSNESNLVSGDKDKGKVVDTMNNFLNNYSNRPFPTSKGKLISRFKLFEDLGVNIQEVKTLIDEYWNRIGDNTPTTKDIQDAFDSLPETLKNTAEESALKWLFNKNISQVNITKYGEDITYRNKFDTVCGRTYSLVLLDKDGNYLKSNLQGDVDPNGITLAWQMPVVEKNGNKYNFANIKPADLDGIQEDLKQLYEIQEKFKSDTNYQVDIKDIEISKGAKVNAPIQTPVAENIEIEKTGENKGKIFTEDSKLRVFTKMISPEDAIRLAKIRLHKNFHNSKDAKDYFNAMVGMKNDNLVVKKYLDKIKNGELLIQEAIQNFAEEVLQKRWYNTPLALEYPNVLVNDKVEIEVGKSKITRQQHLQKYAYTETPSNTINKKLYFKIDNEIKVKRPIRKAPPLRSINESIVTREQEIKALMWFNKSFLSKDIEFNLAFLENNKAFADFTNTAITLYRGSNYTHLYHEAWHRFTQHYLTEQERNVLYNAVSEITGISKNELLQSEEILAEGFRSLMLSGGKTITLKGITIDMNKPTEQQKPVVSWYKKVLDFFKSMFKKSEVFADYYGNNPYSRDNDYAEVIKKYMKEATKFQTSRTNLYTVNPNNPSFDQLYSLKTITYEKDGQAITLDSVAMFELQQGIDALFVEAFDEIYPGSSIASIDLQSKEGKEQIVNFLYEEVYDKLVNHSENLSKEKQKEFDIILYNFNDIIKETSSFRKELNKYFDEEIEIDLEAYLLKTAETHEKKSQKETSNNSIYKMLQSIPRMKNGKPEYSKIWGLPLLHDVNAVWGLLQSNLSGKNYSEMLVEIKKLSDDKHPELKKLLSQLPPNQTVKESDLYLKVAFEQNFNYNLGNPLITYLDRSEDGKPVVKVSEAGSSNAKQIIKKWVNATSNYSFQQIQDIVDSYSDFGKLENITMEKAVEFLKELNFEFTDLDIPYAISRGFKEKEFKEAIFYIRNRIQETLLYNKKDFNPISQIMRDRKYPDLNNVIKTVKGEDKSIKIIAALELMTNNYMSDDMVVRPDNSAEWKMKQYNYISRLIYNMDHMTKEELLEVYPQFDRTKNPGIIFSPMYKSIFDTNGNINTTGVKLEMFSLVGITDMTNLKGLVTVDLKAPEQALGDFWSFITKGKEQFTRFGDKSSAFGANVSVTKSPLDLSDEAINNNIISLLQAEIYNYQHFERVLNEGNIPKSSKQYIHRNKKLILFDKIISNKELKDKLISTELTLDSFGELSISKDLEKQVLEEVNKYFEAKTQSFKTLLLQNLPEGFNESNLIPDEVKGDLTTLVNKYLKTSTSHRMDTFLFLFGDLKNFKNGNDVYKRLSSNSATGMFPTLDEDTLDKLGERKIEEIYRTEKSRENKITSKFTIAQFNNVPVNLPTLLVEAEQDLKAKEALKEYVKLDGKDKGDRADAQGAATLDFYRTINILIGRWDIPQQDAYNAQVYFMKIKKSFNKTDSVYIEALNEANKTANDLLVLWNPKKWQYSGSILSKHTVAKDLDLRMFLKFSVAPLIPSVIENTDLERVAENMYKSGTDLYTFSSGSKNTTDQENQNFNNWTKEDKTDFQPTVLSLHNFKEQLPIDNKFKEEAIFASQMRALLASGLYENGEPVRDTTNYQGYKNNLSNLSQLAALELKDKLSTPEKLISFLEKEFDKRDVPHHIKDFITIYKDTPGFTFDTSFQSYYILNTLFSIVTKKLIKPSYNGGQFVQVSDLGYTNATYKDNAAYGNKDLKMYPQNPDGSSGKAEIKIAFSKKYEGLLNLEGIDGERIGSLERLNQALSNEEWVKQHGDKVTLVACRIPVQSFSTMESFIVKEFLPRVAGQIVIVPPGLTIKTGSDFDIDKLNIYEPVIARNGELVSNESKDIVKEYTTSNEIQADIEAKIKALKEENTNLQTKVKEEILPELDALEEEEDEDVVEFPISGTFNLEDLKEQFKSKEPVRKTDLNKSIEDLRAIYNKNLITLEELRKKLKNVKAYRKSLASAQVNEMINNISNIILAKENRGTLLQPNEIKEVDELFVQVGIGKKEDLTLELSDAIDVEVSNQVGQTNFEAKNSLGIAAKMNKAFALFQEVGIRLKFPVSSIFIKKEDNNGWLSESFTQEYKGLISINNVRNGSVVTFDKFTGPLDKVQILSQFVSGTVDVANDPRIGEINFNKKTASVYIHGILKGIHLYDLASIMLNPKVKDLINDLNKRDYLFYKYLVSGIKDTVEQQKLRAKQSVKEKALRNVTPTEVQVFTDGFFDLNKTLEAIFNYELAYQYPNMLALAEYLKLEEESKHTTTLSMAMSWDTNNSKSFAEYEQGNRLIRDLKANNIFYPEGLDKLSQDSSVSSLKMNNFVNEEYGKLFSIINNPLFVESALSLYDETFGIELGVFMRDFTNDYLTYLYQNYSNVYQEYIIDKGTLTKNNPNNLEQRLKDLKIKLKNTGFEDNYFIKQLIFKKEENSDYMNPQTLSSNISPIQQTMYHEELMKMYYSDYSLDADLNLEVMEWTKDLIHSALVLNGPVRRTGSIIDFLPQDKLMSYTETVANHTITQPDLDLFIELFKLKKSSKFFNEYQANDSIHYNNYFISKTQNIGSETFTTKINQFQYTYNVNTNEVIHNSKTGDKVETNYTQIGKVLAEYAKANNLETVVFNKQTYSKVGNIVVNINNGSIVVQKQILDLFVKQDQNQEKESIPQIQLNEEQQKAVDAAVEFITSGNPLEFYLIEGKAGTGKTTIAEQIAKQFKNYDIQVAALSHKAKSVIREKFIKAGLTKNVKFNTIASLLGQSMDLETGSFDLKKTENSFFNQLPIENADIIIIDEASMINEQVLELIMKNKNSNAKVIFLGDIGQLPPIRTTANDYYKNKLELFSKKSPVFETKNKSKLLERVRQGEESPILPYADYFWENSQKSDPEENPAKERNNTITNKGSLLFVNNFKSIQSQVLSSFEKAIKENNPNHIKVVTYRNDVRRGINNLVHNTIFGINSNEFNEGELIIFNNNFKLTGDKSIENATETQILNTGDIFTDDFGINYQMIEIDLYDTKTEVPVVLKESITDYNNKVSELFKTAFAAKGSTNYKNLLRLAWAYKEKYAMIDYAYAITSHKSQGSTYDIVIVDEKDIMTVGAIKAKEKSESIYTALTRPKNLAVVISSVKVEDVVIDNLETLTKQKPEQDNSEQPIVKEQSKQNNTNPVLEKLQAQVNKLKLHSLSPVEVTLFKGSTPTTTYFALKENGYPIVNIINGSIFVTMKDGSMFRFEDITFPENPGTNEIC